MPYFIQASTIYNFFPQHASLNSRFSLWLLCLVSHSHFYGFGVQIFLDKSRVFPYELMQFFSYHLPQDVRYSLDPNSALQSVCSSLSMLSAANLASMLFISPAMLLLKFILNEYSTQYCQVRGRPLGYSPVNQAPVWQ